MIGPLVEDNAINQGQAKQSPASSSSDTEASSDQSSRTRQTLLAQRDMSESVMRAISQSVTIDTGLVKPRRRLRDQRKRSKRKKWIITEGEPGHDSAFEDLPGGDATSEERAHEQESSKKSSTESESDDDFDDSSINASQILQSSGVFHRPTIRSQIHARTTLSHQNSLKSEHHSMIRSPTIATTSSEECAASQGVTSASDGRTSSQGTSENRLELEIQIRPSSSSSTLQELMRKGAYPLQRASGIAGLLRTQSKRVSNLLTLESRDYYDKVTGMWAGKKTHYDETEAVTSDDGRGSRRMVNDGDRFRAHFALPPGEKLQAAYHGWLHRTVPIYGKLYIGERKLCFRGLLMGQRTKVRGKLPLKLREAKQKQMILPFRDIENVDNENGFRFGYSGMVVIVKGHEELFFEFASADGRNDCTNTLLRALDAAKDLEETRVLSPQDRLNAETAMTERDLLDHARQSSAKDGADSLQESVMDPGEYCELSIQRVQITNIAL